MKTSIITPLDLPLVPPMDLNHHLPNIDNVSPFPMQLRSMRGVGLFAARRGNSDFIRTHDAIDLLAPVGTKIYATASGKIIGGGGGAALIFHDYGFKFMTYYQHMENKLVRDNDFIVAGQQIGEVGRFDGNEDHLHFGVFYPFDNVGADLVASLGQLNNALSVDPTFVMYNWEKKAFLNNDNSRNIIDNTFIESFEEIVRGRQLRFIKCKVKNNDRNLYIPVQTDQVDESSLIETLRQAFFNGKKIRIVWRESLFFSAIEDRNSKISIVAELKVYS